MPTPSKAWNSTPDNGGSNKGRQATMGKEPLTSTRCQECGVFPSWQRSHTDRRRLCEDCWKKAAPARPTTTST